MTNTNKVKFEWKGNKKQKDFSEFLINKQQALRLPAPKEQHEVEETKIVKAYKATAAVAHYSSLPVKYATLPIKYTAQYAYATISNASRIRISPKSIITFLHIILNIFITDSFIYIFGFLIYFLRIDVIYKINEKRELMKGIISNTKKKYILNKCDPLTRVPAMEKQCSEWENILKNGFSALNYTKIIIELIASTIDGFISKITYKTLASIAFLMVFYLKYRR